MAAQSGRTIRISRDGTPLVGARSDSLTIAAEPLDATDKDDNGWRTLIGDVSTRTVSASVECVMKNSDLAEVMVGASSALLIGGTAVVDGMLTLTGDFYLQNIDIAGEQGDVLTFTATLEGSGLFVTNVAPYIVVAPAITGTGVSGDTLTRTLGTWAGDATITYATQWQSSLNGVEWADTVGTGVTFAPGAGLIGRLIRVRITATNSVGSTIDFSNTIGPVTA